MGLPIGEDHLLTPSFVEDHMVIVQDAFDLGFRLIKLYNTYEQNGFTTNVDKTEYLKANSNAHVTVLIKEQKQVKQVNKFKHFG